VMRLCCFDSSMELPLSCRSEDRSCYVLQLAYQPGISSGEEAE
jgi:hypothetical protein